MKMEDKEIYECAKKIKEYCEERVKHNCNNCVFKDGAWCQFDESMANTPDQWLLPELEERK